MRNTTSISFIFFVSVLISLGQSQIPPDLQLQINTLVDEFINFHNIPGLGLSLIKGDGEILYNQGYGFRDIENQINADDATIFAIGSISKSFTATVIVRSLSEQFHNLGEIVLDIPIRQLAPSYNFTLGDRYRSESITFRDLLSHRVCILPESMGIFVDPFGSAENFLYRQRYAPQVCQFRGGYVYNNAMVALASNIIGHLANSTFDVILAKLFTDIGMNDSTVVRQSDDHNNMSNRSVPYYQMDGQLHRFNPELLKPVSMAIGSGGILTSARDMAKYMQFHLNQGKVGSDQIVNPEAMQWLYRASNLNVWGSFRTENAASFLDLTYSYGLGLDLGVYDGWQTIYHGGFLPPYESFMTLAPGLKLGIFTTFSGPGSTQETEYHQQRLHAKIFDAVLGVNRSDSFPNTRSISPRFNDATILTKSKVEKKPKLGNTIKIEPGDLVGNFGSGQSGQIVGSLRLNDSGVLQPYLSYGVWGQAWLIQVSNTTFLADWDSDVVQVFATGTVPPDFQLFVEFWDVDTFGLVTGGAQMGTDFVRNVTLDQLPVVPYLPDSCGLTNFN
ncbi:uncharacterized protein LOC110855354 [Folsomia candida]|uniref:Protein flp n=1 Tax=Folsomia candida TaxID=158441 RepID=A0A226DUC1_FOLCA|nr:uncharacterized protein LOC110855354 [Folsomia candida]OXA48311.1 Protein flp [Folsomia candida]